MEDLSTESNLPLEPKVLFYRKLVFYVFISIAFLLFFYSVLLSAPSNFPVGDIVNIQEGESLRSVSLRFQEDHIIRSRVAFETFVILFGGEKHVIPADYLFENNLSVFEVARRVSKGERHLAPVKITIPEGMNISEMAQIFASRLPNFNKDKFLQTAKEFEGYLFPDTYFFFTNDGEDEVIKSMSENFDRKMALLGADIKTSGKTEKEILIMASIIEREAKGEGDRSVISGILWKRLKLNMPLQVDAAPETYKTRGLPKNPIGNPGTDAINAAIFPKSSSYLYYLHDKNGNVHYARTFSEHRQNILKYLK